MICVAKSLLSKQNCKNCLSGQTRDRSGPVSCVSNGASEQCVYLAGSFSGIPILKRFHAASTCRLFCFNYN